MIGIGAGRRWLSLLGLGGVGALVALTAVGCGRTGSGAALEPSAPIDLVVLHTNDTWGETDPCG